MLLLFLLFLLFLASLQAGDKSNQIDVLQRRRCYKGAAVGSIMVEE